MKSSSDNSSSSSPRKNDYLSSRDWMSDYKQSHVDVDYNRMDLLSSSTTNTNKKVNPNTTETTAHQQTNTNISSGGTTDWGAMFHKSIGTAAEPASSSNILPPPNFSEQRMMSSSSISSIGGLLAPLPERSASTSSFKPSVDFGSFLTPSTDALINGALASSCSDDAFPKLMDSVEFKDPILPTTDIASTIVALAEKNKAEDLQRKQTQKAQRNKKKASSRRFKEPIIKEYVVPTDNDVLLGRGGRSNHHPGNKAYRDEVGNIRESYRSSEKSHKTDLSQMLVNWVQQERGGRFLKQDGEKWYVVTNIVARRKASQALREHMTKEEREAIKNRARP